MRRNLAFAILPVLAASLALASCQSGNPTGLLAEARGASSGGKAEKAWTGPQAGLVQPFREAQFAYRPPLEVSDGGAYMRLQYDEKKDINQRDEVPVRKVRSWYVSPLPRDAQKEGEYGPRAQKYRAIGATGGGSKITVIYIHGRGGNRDWGFDDERFGGNYNRLKHLIVRTGGLYFSPDFTDFEATGLADVKELVAKARALTTGKLVVACGSLGNVHCYGLARDAKMASMVDGMVILAGFPDESILSSPLIRGGGRKTPLMIVHGSWDPTFDYKPMESLFRKLRAQAPNHPVRFLLFETGKHGAPVRMIDWRDTLNWISSL